MKVRNISLADVAHETARCPARMLPHHAGARLDEFALKFKARERPHDLVHLRFLDHLEIGTYDIRPGSGANQGNFRLLEFSNCRGVHRNSVPHDRGLILRQSVRF